MSPRRNQSDSDDDLPLATNLIISPLQKFKVPSLKCYDGSEDLDYHLQTYKIAMQLHEATKPLICMTFLMTLRKAEFTTVERRDNKLGAN